MSPTLGVGSSTDLVIRRSACRGVSGALALLLPVSGSNWSARLIDAVFACGLGLTTVTAMLNVCVAPEATVPIVQIPVVGSKAPAVARDDPKLTPAGRRSCTATPVAASGPLL